MKLLIAIPALNEEDSIASIIQRSLEARAHIIKNSGVTDVDITVVSDGSTDRTVERALKFKGQIKCIEFQKNRGYGAAIKQAWIESDADLLGFLDADGTCDPLFFAELCRCLVEQKADVTLGCRLNRDSKMPAIRRVGNVIFASLLSVLASSRVRDTASGMRVVRRESLRRIFPLPDGLHFTPSMSGREMLSDGVKIVVVDMPYHERAGESKLRAVRDGIRFLRVILETALLYRPTRPLAILSLLSFAIAAALIIGPLLFYLQHRSVLEWMIYRFVTSDVFAIAGCVCISASSIADRMIRIALFDEVGERPRSRLESFFSSRWFWLLPAVLVVAGGALVISSFLSLLRTGAIYEHWSRFVVMSFCASSAVILTVTRLLHYTLNLLEERMKYWRASGELILPKVRT
jgi:glycosyltransferase involved in cell wall biosynthesis